MVVVVRDRLHDPPRSAQAGPESHEHKLSPGVDEPVDQVLRKRAIDLRRSRRSALAAVQAGVVDVDVETVLMRGMERQEVAAS